METWAEIRSRLATHFEAHSDAAVAAEAALAGVGVQAGAETPDRQAVQPADRSAHQIKLRRTGPGIFPGPGLH